MSEVKRASSSSTRRRATGRATRVQVDPLELDETTSEEVKRLLGSTHRRVATPLRKSFVRNDDVTASPPLAQLVSTRGRGARVPLALYLALLRRSSAEPYTTDLSSRRWATLLGLENPGTLGARRVADGMARLQDLRLVSIEPHRGEAATITILREDGSGAPYVPPSQTVRGGKIPVADQYFKLPDALWQGHIQSLSAPALAMLLVLAAEPSSSRNGTWWSVKEFPQRYGISASMRARGTSELGSLGLVTVKREKFDTARGANGDERDRVRNIYRLVGSAVAPADPPKSSAKPDSKATAPARTTRT